MCCHSLRTSAHNRRLPQIALQVLLIAGFASPLHGGPITFDVTKTVTWTPGVVPQGGGLDLLAEFYEQDPAPSPDPAPAVMAQWRFAQHVYAEHLQASDHKDHAMQSPDPADALAVPNASQHPPDQFRWSPMTNFNQLVALPVQRRGPLTAMAQTVQATSLVELSTAVRLGPQEIDAIIRVSGQVDIGSPGPRKQAESFGAGEILIQGQQKRSGVRDGNGAPLTVRPKNLGQITGFGALGVNPTLSQSFFQDPLAVNIFDMATGELIAGQQIYSESWRIAGPASITSTGEGIFLSADTSGSATIEMSTLGEWVLTPFAGSAFLRNGILTLSGSFAGLDWHLDSSSDIATAFLGASQLESLLSLHVLPTGLGDPANDLLYRLSAPGAGFALEAIPEPASLLLMAMGAVSGLLRGYRGWRAERAAGLRPALLDQRRP